MYRSPLISIKYLDMNTLFLFGEPIGMLSQSPPPHAQGFLDAFQAGFNGCGLRIAFGPLGKLIPKGDWLKACRKTHEFADVYVDRALQYREKYNLNQDGQTSAKQRTLLYNMAQQTDDRSVLRNQIIQAMMAAQETTASLISNVIQMLASNASVMRDLRNEVTAVGDQPLNFDQLTRMKLLQNVITESTYASFQRKTVH